jgi:hypothetical protein
LNRFVYYPVMRCVPLALLLLLPACSGPSRTFDITVKNDLARPITIWLTKSGAPSEEGWRSPEDLAMTSSPQREPRLPGIVLDPGKRGDTGRVNGHFPQGTQAILRVYLGEHKLSELLAMSRSSTQRIDVPLTPGKNRLVVHERHGAVAVDPMPE